MLGTESNENANTEGSNPTLSGAPNAYAGKLVAM